MPPFRQQEFQIETDLGICQHLNSPKHIADRAACLDAVESNVSAVVVEAVREVSVALPVGLGAATLVLPQP